MTASTSLTATLTRTDRDRTIATLVAAFAADPVIRWVFPRSDRYLVHFPELLQRLGGAAFDAGTADHIEEHAGAALWVPPGQPTDDEGLLELLQRSIEPQRQPVMLGFLEQVQEWHPVEPHWYLPFIGVDPRCQGRGLGSRLLERSLARCDEDGLPAYLEASSPRNRVLYERHGFEVAAVIQAGDSPPLWPMVRPAR
jgi:ribosomal protein S18 acetylase RimI-like enzyme